MKKILLTVIFLSLITTASFANDYIPNDVYYSMRQSVVSIFSTDDNGMGYCTGTVIKNDLHQAEVLTAKHCIDTFEEVYVENILVVGMLVSADDDLALLITDEMIPNHNAVKMASCRTQINDMVYHLGYPPQGLYTISGRITNITSDHQYFLAQSIGGCSGGGVFNENGELAGVLWGGTNRKSIFEPLQDINRFLKNMLKRYE